MKNMRKGLALLLSVIILVSMMPIHTIAAETVPTTTGETTIPESSVPESSVPESSVPESSVPESSVPESSVPESSVPESSVPESSVPESSVPESSVPESSVPESSVPESSVPESSVPESSVPEPSVPEKVKVSCIGGYMKDGELIPGNDTISAEGYNLVSISAIWADGYDELLTELYGDSYWASPYEVNVEGYVPGEPITVFVEIPADTLLPENVAVYYIDADGNYRRIDNITVREVEQEEPPADEEAEQEELPTDEEVEQEKLLLTEVEFTVTELGVFAVGNEPGIHYWHDDYIDLYAAAHGLTGVSAVDQKATVDTGNTFTDYICYTIVPEGITANDYASYAIAMPEEFDMDNLALYAVLDEGLFSLDFTVENGMVFFKYFGEFTIACGVAAVPGGYPLTGLELTGNLPTDCFVGESVSLTDAKVTAVYTKDGDVFRKVLHPVNSVEEDGYMVTADTSAAGQTTVYVTYGTATATFTIHVHQEKFEDNETGVRVEVGTFGTTGVSVAVLDNASFENSTLLNYVENFVAYDIDLTGYRQGDMATVTLPIPEGVERPAVFYVPDDGTEVVRMPATINGDSTITFHTNHFSTYAVGDERITGETVSDTTTMAGVTLEKITITVPRTESDAWILTDSLENDQDYLIVNTNDPKIAGNALINNDIKGLAVDVITDSLNKTPYIRLNNNAAVWKAAESNSTWALSNNETYVGWESIKSGRNITNNFALTTDSTQRWTLGSNSLKVNLKTYDGIIFDNSENYYLTFKNNAWTMQTSSANVYFYEQGRIVNRVEATYGIDITVDSIAKNAYNVSTEQASLQLDAALSTTVHDQLPSGGKSTWDVVSNNKVASVDQNGLVTFSGTEGSEAIRVSHTWKEGNTDCTISNYIVLTAKKPVYDVYISPSDAKIKVGTEKVFTASVTVDNVLVEKPTIQWTSSNPDIASVDANGKVTGHKVGDVIITATYTDKNGKTHVDEATVEVADAIYVLELCQPKQDASGFEPITAPIVKKNIEGGETDNIWAVITKDGNDIGQLNEDQLKKLTFVSSNEAIAKVDQKTGQVTFQGGEGTVVITAAYEYADGKSVTDTVVFSVSKDQYVVPEDGTDDFPEYPNQGSIRFDKHATAVGNFADTGMVQVELSMTGVPFTTGSEIDVVIMLDISKSMKNVTNRVENTVIAAQEALELLVTNEDGTFNKNRVAIYGFCGWDTKCGGNNENDYTPYVEYIAGQVTKDGSSYNVYQMAGMQTYDADKLSAANTAIQNRYNNLGSGTNYAAALLQCYKTLNETKIDGRDQYLIFMTDGAPSTGFAYVNNDGGKSVYAAYNLTSDGYGASANRDYDNKDVTDLVKLQEYYSLQMKNNGVEIYTVAMQIASNDDEETTASHTILENIASGSDHALVVGTNDNPSKVVDVFQKIAQKIKQAATDVKVTDKIAKDYTMAFEPPNATVGEKDGNQEYYIEVREYQLNAEKDTSGNIVDYTRGKFDSKMKLYMGVNTDGSYYAATAANSTGGDKFATPTFDTTPLGTKHYWTTDVTKGDSGITIQISETESYYFVSTGKGTHNMISGAYAYGTVTQTYVTDANGNATEKVNKTSKDLIIATPYFVYNAATRLLVWTADKLSSTELALSYFLYLDRSGGHVGSEHETPAGTYETNDYATLEYKNFQDKLCEQVFPVPQMTWNGAQVSYVFYLVNEEGQPVNRAGRVVPFSEAVYVTDVFTYSIIWNELETSDALEADRLAKDLVPEVYELYDKGAAYKIHVYEDQNQANLNNHFLITKGDQSKVNTTYVFNTKSDAVKYTTPGIHAESSTFLCRGEGKPVPTKDDNGNIISFSYTPVAGEVQKQFTTQPYGTVFYDNGFAYFKGAKDADGNDTYYTIVEKKGAEKVKEGFDFSNTTVAFAVMWLPRLEEDTVVIDFGLDVMVEVAINDALSSQVLGVFNEKPGIAINSGTYEERLSNNDPINLDITTGGQKVTVGKAYADTQNSVRVSLDKSKGMLVKDPLLFYYESEVAYYSSTNSETLKRTKMYSSVTVIPATTIYYEDEYVNLSSEINENGSWKAVENGSGWDAESKAATNLQSNDRPGESKVSELYDADNLYGYDPAYSSCSTYSLGNAAKFTASETKRGVASFEFYGTGFDIISMTSNTTGTIIVRLFPWDTSTNGYSNRSQVNYIVDTYYGYTSVRKLKEITYTFEDGEWVETERKDATNATAESPAQYPENPEEGTTVTETKYVWEHELVKDGDNALYQVPVMKVVNQPYGRYKAEIQIRYSPAFNHTASESYDFYLDAIRIYDPAGDDPTNETVKNAYEKDGESWPVYAELRNWVIDAQTYGTIPTESGSVSGAVFIDGAGEQAAVEDYKNFGPNNELYLAKGQAVSFQLDGAKAKTIQLAMKSVGGTANPKIWYIDGEAKEYKSYNISTATDMYYDITALKGKTVVIRNDGDAILSITNVKMTFANKEDKPATAEEIAQVMSVNRVGTEAVLRFMRRPPQDLPPIPEVPETTVPETTVPETTVPETTVPETTIPETTVPETTVPETTVPETTVPENAVPETTVPETTVPETTVPETTVPETTVPETTVPETTVPETTVPETTVPETTVPETTVPETTAPKNPTSKPTGSKPTEPKPTETTPTEPEPTITEATEPVEQPSDDPEIAVTEEPEQEQNRPPVAEQAPPVEEETPEIQKTVWEMFVDWITNLFNFIIGLFGGWY